MGAENCAVRQGRLGGEKGGRRSTLGGSSSPSRPPALRIRRWVAGAVAVHSYGSRRMRQVRQQESCRTVRRRRGGHGGRGRHDHLRVPGVAQRGPGGQPAGRRIRDRRDRGGRAWRPSPTPCWRSPRRSARTPRPSGSRAGAGGTAVDVAVHAGQPPESVWPPGASVRRPGREVTGWAPRAPRARSSSRSGRRTPGRASIRSASEARMRPRDWWARMSRCRVCAADVARPVTLSGPAGARGE